MRRREVYLNGEAFFSVTPSKTRQKFIVNISDNMNVEVLGAKFNVSKRKSATRVVLNSGKILLNLKEPEGTEPVLMNPGELVEFNENSAEYIKKKVNVEIYSAWRNHKLILDNTTLRQVLIMLEENYGLKSYISDMDLLDQKVSGTIPAENIEILVRSISITYGLDILKNGYHRSQNCLK
jgi:transmembrane sensor